MYWSEAPLAICLAEPSCLPRVPAHQSPTLTSAESDVVIRAPREGKAACCDACGERFSAAGPTAYADDAPLCDRCVFQHDVQLAMVLAAVSVLRAYGSDEASAADSQAALDLLSFARLYEAFAATHGPRREPEMP